MKRNSSRCNSDKEIRRLTGLSILLASAVILQLISNYVQLGTFSITLALIPVVLAGILYGPLGGTFLGLAIGALTIAAPATLGGIFFLTNPLATVITCLVKMTMAGLLPSLIFLLFKKKHPNVGIVLSSLSAPLINTGLFVAFSYLFFYPTLVDLAGQASSSVTSLVFLGFCGGNFLLEFSLNAALSPALLYLCKALFKRKDIGSDVIGSPKREITPPESK